MCPHDLNSGVWPGLLLLFFQAEDGIRDTSVTGVQTCALPIWGYSWHKSLTGDANIPYNNALDNVSFVDGHARAIKLYYSPSSGLPPFCYYTYATSGQSYIPAGYDWQNAPD